MTFASKLKAWREREHLSQESAAQWLSRELGVTVSPYTLISWEQNRNVPHDISRATIEKAIQ